MSEFVEVTLKKPVTHDGVTYTVLKFREAEVGDMLLADKFDGDFARTIAALSSISEVPLPAFKKIKVTDLNTIIAATSGLLGNESSAAKVGES